MSNEKQNQPCLTYRIDKEYMFPEGGVHAKNPEIKKIINLSLIYSYDMYEVLYFGSRFHSLAEQSTLNVQINSPDYTLRFFIHK